MSKKLLIRGKIFYGELKLDTYKKELASLEANHENEEDHKIAKSFKKQIIRKEKQIELMEERLDELNDKLKIL